MSNVIVTILEKLKLTAPFRNEKSDYILMHDKETDEVSAVPVDAVLAKVNDRVNALVYPDGFTKTTPVNRVGNKVTIAPNDFEWKLELNPYTNADAFEKVLDPTTSPELKRMDTLAATKQGTIVYYQGDEDEFVIQPPNISSDELRITNLTIFGDEVQEHTEPIITEVFTREEKEKLALLDPNAVTDSVVNVIYHQTVATNTGTVSSVGTNWTGAGTSISENMIGGKIVVDGSGSAIIATVNQGAQTFTTDKAMSSDVTNSSFEIHYKAVEVDENGEIKKYRALDGIEITRIQYNGDAYINGLRADANGNVQVEGYVLNIGGSNNASLNSEGEFKNKLTANIPYFINDLPIPENNRPSYATVKDALNPVYGEIPVAGGTANCSVFFNGSEWIVVGGKFGLRNIANTITSFFSNSNTASRTYTLQNRNGTLADLEDIASVNTNKMNVPTGGEVNYLPKFLTPTSQGKSRLRDTGTYLGLDSVLSPTKDLTLGNQNNKIIGVENSDSNTKGRDLVINAGNTINYQLSNEFLSTGITGQWIRLKNSKINNDIYAIVNIGGGLSVHRSINGGNFSSISNNDGAWHGLVVDDVYNKIYSSGPYNDIFIQNNKEGAFTAMGLTTAGQADMFGQSNGNVYYKAGNNVMMVRTGGSGSFVADNSITPRSYRDFAEAINGDVFSCVYQGDIFKRVGGVGDFISLNQTQRNWTSVAVTDNGNVYASERNGDIYVLPNGEPNFIPTGQVNRLWTCLCAKGNVVYAGVENGFLYKLDTNSLGLPDLDGGTKSERAGTGKGTGKSRWNVYTGQKTVSGTDMQVETKRIEVDEIGALLLLTDHTYADAAAATAAGLRPGSLYWNSSGDLKRLMS